MRRYCRGPDTGVGGILNERQDGALVSSSPPPPVAVERTALEIHLSRESIGAACLELMHVMVG